MAVDKIYTLTDPLTNQVRYVGKSNKPNRRLSQHINESKRLSKTDKHIWINSLLDNGLKPIVHVVDEVNHDALFFEEFYISLFKSWGFNLFNLDQKKTISKLMKGNKYSEGSIHKRKGIKAVIDNDLKVFDSISHASIELNLSRRAISNNINGRSKTAYGIKFSTL